MRGGLLEVHCSGANEDSKRFSHIFLHLFPGQRKKGSFDPLSDVDTAYALAGLAALAGFAAFSVGLSATGALTAGQYRSEDDRERTSQTGQCVEFPGLLGG